MMAGLVDGGDRRHQAQPPAGAPGRRARADGGRYDLAAERWREWALPGQDPQPYAVYVDDRDMVWLSDFAANALVRFDPAGERFASFPLPTADGRVRQLLGREGELWGAESAVDKLVVAHTS